MNSPGLCRLTDDVCKLIASNHVPRVVFVGAQGASRTRNLAQVVAARVRIAVRVVGGRVEVAEHLLAGDLPVHYRPIAVELEEVGAVQHGEHNRHRIRARRRNVPVHVAMRRP